MSSAENCQTAFNFTEPLGVAAGFVHKVNVCPDMPPVQQKLRRLPFAVRDAVFCFFHALKTPQIKQQVI